MEIIRGPFIDDRSLSSSKMQQQRRRPPVPASPISFNNNSNRPMRQMNRR